MYDKAVEVIEENFHSILKRYQVGFLTSWKFIVLQILLNKSKSWWIIYKFYQLNKQRKSTQNLDNNDDKLFQYAATVALNHEEIGTHPQGISKLTFNK